MVGLNQTSRVKWPKVHFVFNEHSHAHAHTPLNIPSEQPLAPWGDRKVYTTKPFPYSFSVAPIPDCYNFVSAISERKSFWRTDGKRENEKDFPQKKDTSIPLY